MQSGGGQSVQPIGSRRIKHFENVSPSRVVVVMKRLKGLQDETLQPGWLETGFSSNLFRNRPRFSLGMEARQVEELLCRDKGLWRRGQNLSHRSFTLLGQKWRKHRGAECQQQNATARPGTPLKRLQQIVACMPPVLHQSICAAIQSGPNMRKNCSAGLRPAFLARCSRRMPAETGVTRPTYKLFSATTVFSDLGLQVSQYGTCKRIDRVQAGSP